MIFENCINKATNQIRHSVKVILYDKTKTQILEIYFIAKQKPVTIAYDFVQMMSKKPKTTTKITRIQCNK